MRFLLLRGSDVNCSQTINRYTINNETITTKKVYYTSDSYEDFMHVEAVIIEKILENGRLGRTNGAL